MGSQGIATLIWFLQLRWLNKENEEAGGEEPAAFEAWP